MDLSTGTQQCEHVPIFAETSAKHLKRQWGKQLMVLQDEACKSGKEVYGYFLFRHFLRDDLLFPAPCPMRAVFPPHFKGLKSGHYHSGGFGSGR